MTDRRLFQALVPECVFGWYTVRMSGFWSRLLSGKRASRHLVAIDIGSNTAIRSLALMDAGGERTLLSKRTLELPVRERETDLIPLISEHLRRILFRAIRELGQMPDAVLLGLGNHFTFNEIATVRRERERPAERIRSEELSSLFDGFLKEHHTRTIGDDTYRLAHLMPFGLTVDGYGIERLGQETRGRTIEATLLATYALTPYLDALERLKSILGGLSLAFIANQAAIAKALTTRLHIKDALIVKIGAKITEVSLITDGILAATGQFPVGGNAFTEAISRRLGIPKREAERMKRGLSSTLLPGRAAAALREALGEALSQWKGELVKHLASEERFLVPERMYLLGGGAKLDLILEILTASRWYGELTFLERIDIQRLEAETIAAPIFRNTAPSLSGPEEVGLAALASRLGELHEQ